MHFICISEWQEIQMSIFVMRRVYFLPHTVYSEQDPALYSTPVQVYRAGEWPIEHSIVDHLVRLVSISHV